MYKAAIAPQDIRFPSDREEVKPGEVKVYHMSPDEIRKRYGPPLTEILPKETLFEFRRQGLNSSQIAERFNLEPIQVKALFARYRGLSYANFAFQEKEEVKVKDVQAGEILTKERYLELKEQGVHDFKIAKAYKLSTNDLAKQKREWGLDGYRLPPKKDNQQANDERKEQESEKGDEPEIESPTSEDKINHPRHYTAGGIETIDYMKAKMTHEEFRGYLLGNVIEYVSRYPLKNGKEDLLKARWYLDRLIEEVGEKE